MNATPKNSGLGKWIALLIAVAIGVALGMWVQGQRSAPAEIHDHAAHAEHAGETDLHTCPMHPEIIQEGPGQCPVCGMNLAPMDSPSKDSPTKGGPHDDAVVIDPAVVQTLGVRSISHGR